VSTPSTARWAHGLARQRRTRVWRSRETFDVEGPVRDLTEVAPGLCQRRIQRKRYVARESASLRRVPLPTALKRQEALSGSGLEPLEEERRGGVEPLPPNCRLAIAASDLGFGAGAWVLAGCTDNHNGADAGSGKPAERMPGQEPRPRRPQPLQTTSQSSSTYPAPSRRSIGGSASVLAVTKLNLRRVLTAARIRSTGPEAP